MIDLLYAFGIGISFSLGVAAGAYLASMSMKKGLAANTQIISEHNNRVEDRLADYVKNSERIAFAVEVLADTIKNKD